MACVPFFALISAATLDTNEIDDPSITGFTIVDPSDPPTSVEASLTPHPFKPWMAARSRLSDNPKAIRLAIEPEIWLIPDLVGSDTVDDVIRASNERYAMRNPNPHWCFHESYGLAQRREPLPEGSGYYRDPMRSDYECLSNGTMAEAIAAESVDADRSDHPGPSTRSNSTLFAAGELPATDAISKIVADEAGLDPALAFHHQVLQYQQDEQYNYHQDCGQPGGKDRYNRGGTALIYLSEADQGGETCFMHHKLCIKPRKGAAVFFQSLTKTQTCDGRSRHKSVVVRGGNKFVLQRWYYTDYMASMEHDKEEVKCDGGCVRPMNCMRDLALTSSAASPHAQAQLPPLPLQPEPACSHSTCDGGAETCH